MRLLKLVSSITVACALSSSALAVDLTVNQKLPIMAPDGKTPLMACDEWTDDPKPICKHRSPRTVGEIIQEVCVAQLLDPQTRGQHATNAKSGALAIRLYGAESPALKIDEIKMVLTRVDMAMDPVTIARMHEILEPGEKP